MKNDWRGVFPALTADTLAATRKAIATMCEAKRTISFDPNLRPALWASPETWAFLLLATPLSYSFPILQSFEN